MKYTINRQKLCWEDFEWGTGKVQQMRGNVLVELTQLHAGLFPFNDTLSLEEVVTQVENDRIAAGVSADNALASEQATSISEGNALASEQAALASEQAALASEQAAAAIFDSFDDRYLGSKASAPLVDNDGDPLLDGSLYYDTTVNYLHVYDLGSTTWLPLPVTILAALTDVNLVSLSEGEVLSWDSGTSKWINIDISSTVQTLTNKTLDSITNFIGANHIHYPVRNESGSLIPKGTVITGSSTQPGTDYIEIVSVTDPQTQIALGITHTDLDNNAVGLAINTGVCRDMVDTSSWSVGTLLYPSSTGGLTSVKPTSGRYQACAVVTRSHATQGTLLVEFTEPKYIASTAQAGYVQLNDTLISTSTSQALTANQGKILKDLVDTKIIASDVTYENLNANGDVGTGATQVAQGDHSHTGVYEPADATILKDADIGSTVQAYDATILKDADIGSTVQAYDATILKDADIGSTVQPYDVDTAKTDVSQTFTAPQRGTLTVDNDGSFDMNVANRFKCTPTGNFTLTFTNIASQGGEIILDNTGGHVISAATTTKVDSYLLDNISISGVYVLGYTSDGTNVYVTGSLGLA